MYNAFVEMENISGFLHDNFFKFSTAIYRHLLTHSNPSQLGNNLLSCLCLPVFIEVLKSAFACVASLCCRAAFTTI